jgi:hypothetical protein
MKSVLGVFIDKTLVVCTYRPTRSVVPPDWYVCTSRLRLPSVRARGESSRCYRAPQTDRSHARRDDGTERRIIGKRKIEEKWEKRQMKTYTGTETMDVANKKYRWTARRSLSRPFSIYTLFISVPGILSPGYGIARTCTRIHTHERVRDIWNIYRYREPLTAAKRKPI